MLTDLPKERWGGLLFVGCGTESTLICLVAKPSEKSSIEVLRVELLDETTLGVRLAEGPTAEEAALTAAMGRLTTLWVPTPQLVAGPNVRVPRDLSMLSGPARMF